jgi:uncharacterized repeat protein (TIGR03803 family)
VYGGGTIFAINTNGTVYTNFYSFTTASGFPPINNDGTAPLAGLVVSGNTLYGTASSGGTNGFGTIFAINTNGTGFTNIYYFTGSGDGADPAGDLAISGNILYGTTEGGGIGSGAMFAVHTDGTGIDPLHSFQGPPHDGYIPDAGLLLYSNRLYGTTGAGGNGYDGTVFAITTGGIGFTNLYNFTEIDFNTATNTDGSGPQCRLVLSGSTLYGTAVNGGFSRNGTIFAVNTNSTGFTNLYNFSAVVSNTNSDGANPKGGLILSGNIFYGTTSSGGSKGYGTVFSFSLGTSGAPKLAIITSGTNVIVTWPGTVTGYTLQSTTNLVSSAVWSTNSPTPVIVNGQNTVTNSISGTQKFYRLSQ